jgi:hypothetical protein
MGLVPDLEPWFVIMPDVEKTPVERPLERLTCNRPRRHPRAGNLWPTPSPPGAAGVHFDLDTLE